eukprot:CAMPEP_0176351852 /NCGR_PEP_ID=MMETSP0126-20121128/10557_1 /TAXON_ID=141414 ORGANISM="Strombidinopsis acuminatum, Strain SPMC142" /NCGR_SAMPLE_ID=MMETSP0126 /ASSEMBLY_ACC=CAM_ASM_000229 /LENGTH=50 /DNA_ID=CAMNT_0017702613 /DNA_START=1163 /DNA_END=1315 /DNA_ORIENTATION=+
MALAYKYGEEQLGFSSIFCALFLAVGFVIPVASLSRMHKRDVSEIQVIEN